MKWAIKIFFRSLRLIIGPFILLWEIVSAPKGVVRQPEEQRKVDLQCRGLILYQFRTCPFCVKVRREIRRLSLNIELRDARKDQQHRAELLQGGGQIKVPCLKITDEQGNSQWMYESSAIIQYLHERFA
jgi:glutaredoxin